MDNSKSSVSIKNKRRSLARYDYHDVLGLIYTIILVAGLGLGMSTISVWQYYVSKTGDGATVIGLFKYLTEVKQFHFNGAYNFAVLLLWCSVGFILAKAFLKFAKGFQKTLYSPKEFSKLSRTFAICFAVSLVSIAIYLALNKLWVRLIPVVLGAIALTALFVLWAQFASQNPKKKAWGIAMAVLYALFNPLSFLGFIVSALAVKRSSNKDEASKCWVYPVLLSTLPAVAVVAYIFLKLPELVYANTIVLFHWIAVVVVALTLLVLPSFFFCYYYFRMHLPATDANYYTVTATTVLGETEINNYEGDEEAMAASKAKKGKSILIFSALGFIPGLITFASLAPSLFKVVSTGAIVVAKGAYELYTFFYNTIGGLIAQIYSNASGVAVRVKPLPEFFVADKMRYEAIDWIPTFDSIREKVFTNMLLTDSIDWIPAAILTFFLLFSILGLILVFITRSKLELYRHEFKNPEGAAKLGKMINAFGLLLGIFNSLVLIVMTYITVVDLVKILNNLSL